MTPIQLTRRALLASAAVLAQPRLKIVFAGGHPGDPECGCGGTIARYTSLGHRVTILYLNRGEGFCGNASLDQCAAIRTAEAEKACAILHAHPAFASQIDGQATVDGAHYEEFAKLLMAESPDALFTQWPVDSHRDHRAVSALALDAFEKEKRRFALYFYEVAEDSSTFKPTAYVDISAVEAIRRAACFAHVSQQPGKWYPQQVELTKARGAESGFAQAEAFVKHSASKSVFLP